MATPFEKIRENHITILFSDTPEAVTKWKNAIEGIEGLWKDRGDIIEEMNVIRKEADRSMMIR